MPLVLAPWFGLVTRCPNSRLSLFGIAATASSVISNSRRSYSAASVSLESRRLLHAMNGFTCGSLPRLSLFGIAATASATLGDSPHSATPPQSLWNRGDCFYEYRRLSSLLASASVSLESRRLLRLVVIRKRDSADRLSLFGIAATASRGRVLYSLPPRPASVSLESRRLLREIVDDENKDAFRLSLFGIAATASKGRSCSLTFTCRLSLFGIAATAS